MHVQPEYPLRNTCDLSCFPPLSSPNLNLEPCISNNGCLFPCAISSEPALLPARPFKIGVDMLRGTTLTVVAVSSESAGQQGSRSKISTKQKSKGGDDQSAEISDSALVSVLFRIVGGSTPGCRQDRARQYRSCQRIRSIVGLVRLHGKLKREPCGVTAAEHALPHVIDVNWRELCNVAQRSCAGERRVAATEGRRTIRYGTGVSVKWPHTLI